MPLTARPATADDFAFFARVQPLLGTGDALRSAFAAAGAPTHLEVLHLRGPLG